MLLFNVPRCPQFNAIEFYFKLVKENVKAMRLRGILTNNQQGYNVMIRKALSSIDRDTIRDICISTIRRILST